MRGDNIIIFQINKHIFSQEFIERSRSLTKAPATPRFPFLALSRSFFSIATPRFPFLALSRSFFSILLFIPINSPLNSLFRHHTTASTKSRLASKFFFKSNIRKKQSEKMDVSLMGFETPFLLHNFHNILEAADGNNKSNNAGPTRAYVRDARAMAATPADVKEYPNSYVFVIDMPGLKSGDIKVQIEDDNVLVISGERKRENEENDNGVKYVRMERRIGKFMRKFALPENANTDKISAICQDGELTVTVEKLPPPEPKKPKMIQVQVA